MTEGPLDGEALLQAIAQGRDRRAFAELFQYYAPRIKAYLRGRRVDTAVVDEVTQDVMLAVWRRADQFDRTRGAASTWIFTVARNCLIDMIRREKRPQVEHSDPTAAPEVIMPEDQMVARAEQRQLQAALAQLPIEQREVLRRSYFSGQTLQEIADSDQLSVGTVKTRVRIALTKLRGMIGRP
ncbi:MAG TPA: sigma-70 family RNA polymerase sigma factor [Polyangia bacterium]|nr:sigma-70 family RNA polymerase sigma factor [Polyangia bacterium]